MKRTKNKLNKKNRLIKPGCSYFYMFASLRRKLSHVGYVLYRINYDQLNDNHNHNFSSKKHEIPSPYLSPCLVFRPNDLPSNFCSLTPFGDYFYFVSQKPIDSIFGNSENIPSWLSVKCFLGDFKIIIYLVLLHLPTPILQILLGLCLCDHHWLLILISGGNSLSVTILFFHVMHHIAAWLLFRPLMVVMYFAVCLTASILNLMTPWLFLAFFISQVHVLLPLQRSLRQLRMISITIKHMCRKSLGLIVTSTQSFFTANCSSYGLLTSTKAGWSLVFLAKLGWCC